LDVSRINNFKIENIDLPYLARVKSHIPDSPPIDILNTMIDQIMKTRFKQRIKKGENVAITVGSRYIDRIPEIVRVVIGVIKRLGANPFIVPAMGSHGGGEAKGQTEILQNYGITENYVGAKIISSMAVECIGKTKTGIPLYIDRNALLADKIIVMNRIKVHPDFSGEIESGLMKMIAIGLGNIKGASIIHSFGIGNFGKIIPMIAQEMLERTTISLGIALLENGHGKLQEIRAIDPEKIFEEEKKLLKKEKLMMPKLPFQEVDILIVNEMGKDISGDGMDPNIIGRSESIEKNAGKNIKIIIPLDLSKKTKGNAAGIGLADIITKKLFDKIDFNTTYTNYITSNNYLKAKIPMVLKNEEFALKTAMSFLNKDEKNIKLVRIKDTLHIEEMEVSKPLLKQIQNQNNIEILGEPRKLKSDNKGFFLDYPYIKIIRGVDI